MPRLVRRRPLSERILSHLNPYDFLLWLSEEFEGGDWDQLEKTWALPIGIALNVIFLIARANSRSGGSKAFDDVFGDDNGTSLRGWLASFIVHLMAVASTANAIYTFQKKRHYRLFENSIDNNPATPSAHRVRVDSSPMMPSPLRYIAKALSTESAHSRAHPDAQRDVWELAIWDPSPLCLRLFCLFSPGHVLVYWLFLPTQLSDPRPSVTIVTTIVLTVLLSVQMSFLSSSYTQQAKDQKVVHKEVFKEYDTKYVQPRTHPLMRDVGTQFSDPYGEPPKTEDECNKVETYSPAHIINRSFKTSPNPNYLKHVDPEGFTPVRQPTASTPISSVFQGPPTNTPSMSRDGSPMTRGTSRTTMRQPQFRSTATTTGDGGSLGVYSHANSPLRKSATTSFDRRLQNNGDFVYKERGTTPLMRSSSPLKRSSVPGGMNPGGPATINRSDNLNTRRETGRF
ncbi:Protein of unknown function DUF2418 [Penicillium samsonianum]|uniref:Protein of unknown function DUF2418 n=1 Tax=Penicillium samsonianum TaxID=1882272 RepID=UPI00254661C6|nr:Protein of unknown function DUF2418 [Penicillium samsonianum]KAJ6133620.1 Protein of unknown function DUF2418 [Penicillium samsonianum]